MKSSRIVSSKEQSGMNGGWFIVNTHLIIGFCGALLCLLWLFLLFGLLPSILTDINSTQHLYDCFIGLVIGVIFSLVLSSLLSELFSEHKGLLIGLSLIYVTISLLVLGFGPHDVLSVTTFFLFQGFGFGLQYVLFGEYLAVFFGNNIECCISILFLGSSIIGAGSVVMDSNINKIILFLVPFITVSAYLFVLKSPLKCVMPLVENEVSDSRNHVSWQSYLSTFISGMVCGFALGILLFLSIGRPYTIPLALLAIFVTFFAILIDNLLFHNTSEMTVMKLFLPVTAIFAFPIIFVDDNWKSLFAIILLCGALVPTALSISAMLRHVIYYRLAPIRAFAWGRCMCFFGIGIGATLARFAFSSSEPVFTDQFGATCVTVGFMLTVIILSSIGMTRDNYPPSAEMISYQLSYDDAGHVFLQIEQNPLSISESIESESPELLETNDNQPDQAITVDPLVEKCTIVGDKFGLTPREKEVLEILARGRTAKYVAEQMVISQHTSKAHIYNIYQKTGVHSQQELMDLVENAALDSDHSTKS